MSDYFELGEEFLEHFGVKGMKWGVRKDRGSKGELKPLLSGSFTRTTANGDVITLTAQQPNKLNKALAAVSKNYRKSYSNGSYLTISDNKGKKIGQVDFWRKSEKELYLNWIQIEKSSRGRGYATEILKAAEEKGSELGVEKMVLEVPGNAPDARHIYEKMGFEATRELSSKDDPTWGGLTEMEYNFKEKERR
jgi:ribosomal protein S18 acetylase RimI-like enzyme